MKREDTMKKIEALITPVKVEEVKAALTKAGVKGMTFSEVRDCGHHPSHVGNYRGSEYVVDLLPEVKVEVVADDTDVRDVTDAIIGALQTGHLSDGEISILPMETVLHVRAGVR
jgi:nitrogen regulatory protein P-II 1